MGAVKKIGIIPKYKEYIILAKKNGVKGLFPDYVPKDEWDKEYNIFLDKFSTKDRELIESISANQNIEDKDIAIIDNILAKVELVSVREAMKWKNVKKSDEKQWLFANAWRIARTAASTSIFRLALEKKKYLKQQLFAVKSVKEEILYIIKSDFDDNSTKPRVQVLFSDANLMTHPGDLWTDIKTTGLEAEGDVEFKNGKKPEALLKRIIGMSTQKGDYVLDSFLGSGTTCAVAHKMERKWIGIELGDHAFTHCATRMKKVIEGVDKGGITEFVNWKGGGGFKFYTLAPSLLKKDKYGQWVISQQYNADMLAAAMAKHEGFRYLPDENIFWKQGKSSEKDYIYTTTQFITIKILDSIYQDMKADENLLITCKAFQSECFTRFANITIKKIPHVILGRCEFGKEDYSLNIINLPKEDEDTGIIEEEPINKKEKGKDNKYYSQTLFDD
ncbi:MAG: DNA methyltransferase [bacterium]